MKGLSKFLVSFFLAIVAILVTASGGDWFRVFLHAIGHHWWTSWKEEATSPVQAIAGVRVQGRQCRICGMSDRRQF